MPHFEAEFRDGTRYIQNNEDTSLHTEGRNAFYDILQRESEVDKFHVVLENGTTYTVDLNTGHFAVNDVEFLVHDQFYTPKGKLRLIYFKEMKRDTVVTGTVLDDLSVDQKSETFEPYISRVFIGWRTEEDNRKGHQETIGIGVA